MGFFAQGTCAMTPLRRACSLLAHLSASPRPMTANWPCSKGADGFQPCGYEARPRIPESRLRGVASGRPGRERGGRSVAGVLPERLLRLAGAVATQDPPPVSRCRRRIGNPSKPGPRARQEPEERLPEPLSPALRVFGGIHDCTLPRRSPDRQRATRHRRGAGGAVV